jgi:hypothetical protein
MTTKDQLEQISKFIKHEDEIKEMKNANETCQILSQTFHDLIKSSIDLPLSIIKVKMPYPNVTEHWSLNLYCGENKHNPVKEMKEIDVDVYEYYKTNLNTIVYDRKYKTITVNK